MVFVVIAPRCVFHIHCTSFDSLCGLVVRVPGYRSRGPWFNSQCYQIFWEVVSLERGPLSLMSTIEELLGRNGSGSSLEIQEYSCGDPLHWPRDTLYLQKLSLTSLTSGSRLVNIVHSLAKATEFSLALVCTSFYYFVHWTYVWFLHILLRWSNHVGWDV
jgi:hypothetical protein